MLRGIAISIRDFFEKVRITNSVRRGNPVAFSYRGRTYYVNPESAANYHVKHSTSKLAAMVDLMDPASETVFDIGANCGLFSTFAANKCPSAQVHCFEPSQTLIPIIQRNVSGTQVEVHQSAVGESSDPIDLYINPNSQQTNSANRDAIAPFVSDMGTIETRQVDCVSVNEFCRTRKINRIDVMKVDVQGFEGAVFRGASDFLGTTKQLFVESTWLDVESVVQLIPFATQYGFTHASVLNTVAYGADILLTRSKTVHPAVKLSFEIGDDLVRPRWW